jgi:hypothetical protein
MSNQELAELLKHSNPKEIYVVTWNNRLLRLKCPFSVEVTTNVGLLMKGEIVLVTEIRVTREVKTVFIIEMNAYYYHHFDILI